MFCLLKCLKCTLGWFSFIIDGALLLNVEDWKAWNEQSLMYVKLCSQLGCQLNWTSKLYMIPAIQKFSQMVFQQASGGPLSGHYWHTSSNVEEYLCWVSFPTAYLCVNIGLPSNGLLWFGAWVLVRYNLSICLAWAEWEGLENTISTICQSVYRYILTMQI